MQDHAGTIVNSGGFDMATTMKTLARDGHIANVPGGEKIAPEAF